MTIKSRQLAVGNTVYEVPRCIFRRNNAWRVMIERVGQPTVRKHFADNGSTAQALERATEWMLACDVRAAFTQIPLHRSAHRQLTLTRRTDRDGVPDARNAAYALRIEPSKSAWLRGWMTIFLGASTTITQKRINYALAVLAARLHEYRKESARTSAEIAVDSLDYTCIAPLDLHPYRLRKRDVLSWSGRGGFVVFSPKPRPAVTGVRARRAVGAVQK